MQAIVSPSDSVLHAGFSVVDAADWLDVAMGSLSVQEAITLGLHHGLGMFECEFTIAECAGVLGFSKERVRFIERGALRKLRCYAADRDFC